MHSRRWKGVGLLGVALLASAGAGDAPALGALPAPARCSEAVIEGEVRAGQEFRKSFGGGLDILLEPIASGWVVRVLPTTGDRPPIDYAGIATPPYRSVSPLLVSTDFSFRAQDAVGWNPRRFRYASSARAFAALQAAYGRVTGVPATSEGDEEALARLASAQPGGVLEILDASLAPGTSDQTPAAGLLSSHFGTTAHRIEQPVGGRATALGRIGWMRFRVQLDLQPGVKAVHGVKVESYLCERG